MIDCELAVLLLWMTTLANVLPVRPLVSRPGLIQQQPFTSWKQTKRMNVKMDSEFIALISTPNTAGFTSNFILKTDEREWLSKEAWVYHSAFYTKQGLFYLITDRLHALFPCFNFLRTLVFPKFNGYWRNVCPFQLILWNLLQNKDSGR